MPNQSLEPAAGHCMHIYEIRPRKDGRGFDLISDVNNKTTPAQLKSGVLCRRAKSKALSRITLSSVRWLRVREAQARLDNFPDGKR